MFITHTRRGSSDGFIWWYSDMADGVNWFPEGRGRDWHWLDYCRHTEELRQRQKGKEQERKRRCIEVEEDLPSYLGSKGKTIGCVSWGLLVLPCFHSSSFTWKLFPIQHLRGISRSFNAPAGDDGSRGCCRGNTGVYNVIFLVCLRSNNLDTEVVISFKGALLGFLGFSLSCSVI